MRSAGGQARRGELHRRPRAEVSGSSPRSTPALLGSSPGVLEAAADAVELSRDRPPCHRGMGSAGTLLEALVGAVRSAGPISHPGRDDERQPRARCGSTSAAGSCSSSCGPARWTRPDGPSSRRSDRIRRARRSPIRDGIELASSSDAPQALVTRRVDRGSRGARRSRELRCSIAVQRSMTTPRPPVVRRSGPPPS